MTTFDQREDAFEKKFVLDEEQKFKAEARRNKYLGMWAAEKLGISGEAANAYARDVITAELEPGGAANVVRMLVRDFAAKGVTVSEQTIVDQMAELMMRAAAEVKAGK